jgi:hypothetical protein
MNSSYAAFLVQLDCHVVTLLAVTVLGIYWRRLEAPTFGYWRLSQVFRKS